MPNQIILFAGLHKTGSTSIQKTCAANQGSLREAALFYPVHPQFTNHTFAFHFLFKREPHKLGQRDMGLDADQVGARRDFYTRLVQSWLLNRKRNLLLVAEGVSVLAADELNEMRGWFQDRGWRIRIVCYVRHISSWINSIVSQKVTGIQHLTIDSAIRDLTEPSGLMRARMENIRQVFPDAEFYSYETAVKHPFGPVGFFFEKIGIQRMEAITFMRANERRSDCATRATSSINEALGEGFLRLSMPDRVRSDAYAVKMIPGAAFRLRRHEVLPILPLLTEENEWLKEALGEEFYDKELAFHDELPARSEESLARLRELSTSAKPPVGPLISSYLGKLGPRHIPKTSGQESRREFPSLPVANRESSAVPGKFQRLQEELTDCDHAIARNPNDANAHARRGKVLRRLNRLDESLASFDRAIALNPRHAAACLSRGILLCDLKRLDESLASIDRAIALKPHYIPAYVNRALALLYLRRFDEALESYERAIALKPGNPEVCWRKADLKLLMGDYKEGWQLNEWRWKSKSYEAFQRIFAQPLWLGEQSVAGKTLLIHAEAGLGDTVQFSRYVPMARELGARVLLEVHAPLTALMSTLGVDISVVEKDKALPDFDLHCPMMSLPLAFKTTVETIPAAVPYLHADPERRRRWHHRLGAKGKFRIGLAWSGRIGRAIDRNPCRKRYFELRLLENLLQLPMEFHSLQKDLRKGDVKVLTHFKQIRAHHDQLNDFADTAALIEEMDLVISVDTAVAHLAGAMGKPVWILLPHTTDYRWMIDRSDSPWYPTATLFRQSEIGDWRGVISRVVERLETALSI